MAIEARISCPSGLGILLLASCPSSYSEKFPMSVPTSTGGREWTFWRHQVAIWGMSNSTGVHKTPCDCFLNGGGHLQRKAAAEGLGRGPS